MYSTYTYAIFNIKIEHIIFSYYLYLQKTNFNPIYSSKNKWTDRIEMTRSIFLLSPKTMIVGKRFIKKWVMTLWELVKLSIFVIKKQGYGKQSLCYQ